jgi:hypothetical protein
MMLLMLHIINLVNLIERLRDPSHDSTPSIASPDPSTSSTPPHGPPPPYHLAFAPHEFAPSIDPLDSPPHVSAPSTLDPPPTPPHVFSPSTYHLASAPHASSSSDPPPHLRVSPSTDPCPSPPHVSSSTDPPPPPPTPHVSQTFDVLDTMFISSIVAQVDLGRETFDSVLLSKFLSKIIIDKLSISSRHQCI